jgi:hypothetical protein
MAKKWVVTYNNPNGRALPLGDCKRHEKNCRHLQPSTNKPHTAMRPATPAEMLSQEECKVC